MFIDRARQNVTSDDPAHTLMHEAAHRGVKLGDPDWKAFRKTDLSRHHPSGDPEEAFADSYSDYVSGSKQHPDLHAFWQSRLDPDQDKQKLDVGYAAGGRPRRRHGSRRPAL